MNYSEYPQFVFNSDAELRGSILRPMSFVFSDTRDTVFDLPISKLPAVKNYAEWFEYTPTAGHLVYYGDDGVEVVYGAERNNRRITMC